MIRLFCTCALRIGHLTNNKTERRTQNCRWILTGKAEGVDDSVPLSMLACQAIDTDTTVGWPLTVCVGRLTGQTALRVVQPIDR